MFPDERSALDIQRQIADGNARLPAGRQMRFRLGINSGPISLQDGGLREKLPFQDDSAADRFIDLLEDASLT